MDYTKLMDFTGKVVFVSGSSRGIGEALVRAFAANGARVIVSSRDQAACDAVAESIRADGGDAKAKAAHAGKMEDVAAVFDWIKEEYGQLDVLVNCGGTNPFYGPIADTPEAAFDKTIDVNLKGPFYLSSEAVKMMKEAGKGAIVNVASINGITPGHLQGIYSMTKSAMINMTKAFAREYGHDGIRVNAICPGLVETKMTEVFTSNDEMLQKFTNQFPIPRAGQPHDMVGGVLYLASDAAAFTTGTTLVMDGGVTA
ncbi:MULTISPECIES: glucose 1-dehydrogenase [Kordiimonas]|uniref:glucose 1-dehydrogenase n=1 Tax=Kordiimonas TaxID=288021 RepID=UPI001FF14EC0|nr:MULTISPECIES: glucose 1-dehydrogenase [Kordiimonas]MCK0069734.1 glucose 1-dehydrogenase [Kordiimonas laminariae]UTW57200.1 glucose 1-dehydrogenase [Kordiimonas sp. SCSIO 12603]